MNGLNLWDFLILCLITLATSISLADSSVCAKFTQTPTRVCVRFAESGGEVYFKERGGNSTLIDSGPIRFVALTKEDAATADRLPVKNFEVMRNYRANGVAVREVVIGIGDHVLYVGDQGQTAKLPIDPRQVTGIELMTQFDFSEVIDALENFDPALKSRLNGQGFAAVRFESQDPNKKSWSGGDKIYENSFLIRSSDAHYLQFGPFQTSSFNHHVAKAPIIYDPFRARHFLNSPNMSDANGPVEYAVDLENFKSWRWKDVSALERWQGQTLETLSEMPYRAFEKLVDDTVAQETTLPHEMTAALRAGLLDAVIRPDYSLHSLNLIEKISAMTNYSEVAPYCWWDRASLQYPEIIDRLIENHPEIAVGVLAQKPWRDSPLWAPSIDRLIDLKNEGVNENIIHEILPLEASASHPEWLEKIMRLAFPNREMTADYLKIYLQRDVLSKPFWQNNPALREALDGLPPTVDELREVLSEGRSFVAQLPTQKMIAVEPNHYRSEIRASELADYLDLKERIFKPRTHELYGGPAIRPTPNTVNLKLVGERLVAEINGRSLNLGSNRKQLPATFAINQRYIVAGYKDGIVQAFDRKNGELVRELTAMGTGAPIISFTGSSLVLEYQDRRAIYDAKTLQYGFTRNKPTRSYDDCGQLLK